MTMSQPGLSHLDQLRIADENETRELYSMDDDDINNNNEIIMMNNIEGSSKSPTTTKQKTKTKTKTKKKKTKSEIPSSSSSSVKSKSKKEKKTDNDNFTNVSKTDCAGQQRRLQSSIVKHKRTIGTGDSEAIRSSSRDSDNINNNREEVVDLLFASSNNVDFKLDFNEIFEIESHKKLTQKERDEYWWNDHERNRSMAKNERIVAKHEKQERKKKKPSSSSSSLKSKNSEATPSLSSTNKKSSQSYIRGLESWTKVGSSKLDKTISKCVAAVMDEQDRQWEEDDDDEIKIAECSINVTKKNAKRARLMGLEDEKEALLLKAESWMNNNDDDAASVRSAISIASYGTVAIAKKKKRSEFLSKVDKLSSMKSKNGDEASNEKKKVTKKKKTKKSSSKSKTKTKSKKEAMEVTSEKGNKSTDDTTVSESTCSTTLPLSTISIFLSDDRMQPKNDNTYAGESLIESLSRQNKQMHYNDNVEQPEFLIRSSRTEMASMDAVGKPQRMFADPPGKTISRKESINCFLQNRGSAPPPPPPRHQVQDTTKKTTTADKKAQRVVAYDDADKDDGNGVEKNKNNDKKNKLWKKLKTKKSSKTK